MLLKTLSPVGCASVSASTRPVPRRPRPPTPCSRNSNIMRSNASDALGQLRFLSVTELDLLKETVDLDIRIQTDKDNGIITITDTRIGMTKQELVDCLGTIAQSGTAKFLKAVKDRKDTGADKNSIGQFGVGFYSAFLVSDKSSKPSD